MDNDLRDVHKIYSILGVRKKWLGPRSLFDSSNFRFVMRQKTLPIAFAEIKYSNSGPFGYLNIGFREERYRTEKNILDIFKVVKENHENKLLLFSVNIADKKIREYLDNTTKHKLGFTLITDRQSLLRYKLPVDGVHISYHG